MAGGYTSSMNLKSQIIKSIEAASGVSNPSLEFSSHEEFGDYTTNIALKSGKSAKDIVSKLEKDKNLSKIIEKIEVKGPARLAARQGFINFYLKKDALLDNLDTINSNKDKYGSSSMFKGQNLMFEFAHPNTHKAFHIGHLRNITTGEALSRLAESQEADVVRANYQGDVGLHIAKAIWGIKKLGFKDPGTVSERAKYLGEAYVAGSKAYEEDEKVKEEIIKINKALYDKSDKDIIKIYQTTRKWSLEYFETIYKRVYTKFDRLYFESEVAELGKKKAKEALEKGILEKSEGAVIYRGEAHGLHNRVFINSKGLPTYEAKDLGLAELEFSEYHPDKILHVVGPEQGPYFKVLFKVLEELSPKTKNKEIHLIYGWVKLKHGKMSSRKGNVVLGEWLLDEVKKQIIEKYKTPEDTAEQIAVGAVKYAFLKTSLDQEIAFSIEESISLEGNSGPYLQYTFARCQSVLAKAKPKNIKVDTSSTLNTEEVSTLRHLSRLPEIISIAAKTYSPNILCEYLFQLAQKYNAFYNKNRIIASDNENFRLALTKGVGQILKNGLNLLGIQAPERM